VDSQRYPVCLGGERACPPEDCRGSWGYGDLLDTIRSPDHEGYDEMMEWLGGAFDPEDFDLEGVNQALRGMRWATHLAFPAQKANSLPGYDQNPGE
jgi:hypothetical protein